MEKLKIFIFVQGLLRKYLEAIYAIAFLKKSKAKKHTIPSAYKVELIEL